MGWLFILPALLLLWLYLLSPALHTGGAREFFRKQQLYAHRGLYDNKQIPENSLPAFRKAVEAGYGVELDVHLTTDGRAVVVHDDTLTRICGVPNAPESLTAAELSELRLLGTDEPIPTFAQVLDVIGGRVPLVVELKGVTANPAVCVEAARLLDGYPGAYCVESFNPLYLFWFRRHRPEVIRGQLACPMPKHGGIGLRLRDFVLENMLLNALSRPQFIAYDLHGRKRAAFRITRALGGVPVAWTVRSGQELESVSADYRAFIFERFLP